jgi:transcriptional regulator with XRE-family HTH domain
VNNDLGSMIRRIRAETGLSQESLARRLNTTKAAVQHWEHGRNGPDLERLAALRAFCPPGRERKQIDELLGNLGKISTVRPRPRSGVSSSRLVALINRREIENARLRKAIARLESMLTKKEEKIRILNEIASQLQREILVLRASRPPQAGPGAKEHDSTAG